jgi:hypothetical protein
MATSSKLFEEYGFKADNKGVFQEWRKKTSSIMEKNPKIDVGDAAREAYKQVVGSK